MVNKIITIVKLAQLHTGKGGRRREAGGGGGGCSAAVKRGAAFLSATELIRSLSFNSTWKFGVWGEMMWV